MLWTGTFRGSTSGVPVSYESKGRQYFVLISNAGGGRGGGRGAATLEDPNLPVGVVAFALAPRDSNNNGDQASRSVK